MVYAFAEVVFIYFCLGDVQACYLQLLICASTLSLQLEQLFVELHDGQQQKNEMTRNSFFLK